MIILATIFLFLLPVSVQASSGPELNPAHIVGPETCNECHKGAVYIWEHSKHAQSFERLKKSQDTSKIMDAMKVRHVNRDQKCIHCHFTQAYDKQGKLKTPYGVSCESCHNPAKNWAKVHNDFGGKDVKKEQETESHRKERWQKSLAAGMISIENFHGLARRCYQCHLGHSEKLINQGGHKAGDPFELLSWSQGELRHTVWHSKGKLNVQPTLEKQRFIYVLGQLLELEFSLRALARATEPDVYAGSMGMRTRAAAANVFRIGKLLKLPEIKRILSKIKTVRLQLNNQKNLLSAAEHIKKEIESFVTHRANTDFSALDQLPLVPPPERYKGKAIQPLKK
ncbi:multiheme c-type cytochrome [Magnetococcales bacterium HHB-1]